MAKFQVLALVAVSVLLMSPVNVYGTMSSDAKEFTIYGQVLCQDCSKDYNTFVNGATPINGAKVDITCPDNNGRPVYHLSDVTDETGYFRETIPYNYYSFILNPQDCIVRLISSPTECNNPTNYNHGKEGVKPQHPTTWSPSEVGFLTGPFFFTISQCALPE